MKKLSRRYFAIVLCVILITTFLNPRVVFADDTTNLNGLQKLNMNADTYDKERTIASPSDATPADANKNADEDVPKSDGRTNSISAETVSSVATLSNADVGAVYYLEDSFQTSDKIELFYGSQLSKPEAAIYHMIGSYLENAEGLFLGGSGSSRWKKSISVEFSELDSEEYSDFSMDVEHELEVYQDMAVEAYSMDHPEYDLTCFQIKNEAFYKDSKVENEEGRELYSGNIRLEMTFSIRAPEYATNIIYKNYQLMDAVNTVFLSGNSRFDKVRSIHNYLCNNVSYNTDKDDWAINTAYGAIVQQKANCNGYARAFKVLCDYFDIPNVIVAGVDLGECIGNTIEYNDDGYRQHLWNYVQMENGEWYAVAIDADVNDLSEDYFLVGAKTRLNGSLFEDSHQPYNFGIYHMNSFENTGRTYHGLLSPELFEDKYGEYAEDITIRNVAVYSEMNKLESKIDELDYVAGNFYHNYGKNIDIENPKTSIYKEQYYMHFTVEMKEEAEVPGEMDITITLPDGISFSKEVIESERTYNFENNSKNQEIWDEITLMYTEVTPQLNTIEVRYKITSDYEVINQGRRPLVELNVLSKIDRIKLELNEGTVNYAGWNTGMFFEDSSQYNQNLALFSAYMSDMIEGSNKPQLRQRITNNLTELGFSKIFYSGVGKSKYIEEFVCATKKVVYNGTVNTILLYAIQGSDMAKSRQAVYDWTGNLSYSEEAYHWNIMECQENNLQAFKDYCCEYGIKLDNSNVRKLITGHSRGGGIANGMAANINADAGMEEFNSLYCYTFAAMNIVDKDKAENVSNRNTNIFNLVNFADAVPFVPGYNLGKFGKTGVFNTDNDTAFLTIGLSRELSLKNVKSSLGRLQLIINEINTKNLIENHLMPRYEEAVRVNSFDWDFNGLSDRIDQEYKILREKAVEELAQYLPQAIPNTSCVVLSPAILAKSGIRHIIECPVDVDVIAPAGNVVCAIRNNQIASIEVEDVAVVIEGDKKEIWYPTNAGYRLQITGYDEGTMDYRVIMPDGAGADKTIYSFSEFPVHKNSTAMTTTNAGDNLTFNNDNRVITPDKIIDSNEFEYVSINLDTDTEGIITPGVNEYIRGDFVWAYAVNDDKNKCFIGWFDEEGELLSQNIFYSFVANEAVHYTAKFSSNGESYCDIYGHTECIIEGWPSTCIYYGKSDMVCCSICNEILVDMEELPLADHTLVINEAVAPTTTAPGLTEGIWCSVCGLVIKEQQVIPKLDDPNDKPDETDPGDNGDNTGGSGGNSPSDGGGGSSSGGGGGSSSGGGGGSSSGGGGGSSSGGGGGSSSGGGGGSAIGGSGKGPGGIGTISLPDYVVKGTWMQIAENWRFTDSNGVLYANRWAAIENPYANTALGQSPFDWFYFDAAGNMVTGWQQDGENMYYLNQNSDGTRGRMITGWFWIPDLNGVQKCYYFNPNSDGTRGKLIKNSVIDGNTVNANGEWILNGLVQIR